MTFANFFVTEFCFLLSHFYTRFSTKFYRNKKNVISSYFISVLINGFVSITVSSTDNDAIKSDVIDDHSTFVPIEVNRIRERNVRIIDPADRLRRLIPYMTFYIPSQQNRYNIPIGFEYKQPVNAFIRI